MAKSAKIDIDRVDLKILPQVFRVTPMTVNRWVRDGLPAEADGTYTVYGVHRWLMERNSKGKLKDEKTQAEIALLQAKLEKTNENYILRADHEQAMAAWASSFKKFWQQAVRKNVHHFVMKEIDQVNVLFESFGRQLMEVWAGAIRED